MVPGELEMVMHGDGCDCLAANKGRAAHVEHPQVHFMLLPVIEMFF